MKYKLKLKEWSWNPFKYKQLPISKFGKPRMKWFYDFDQPRFNSLNPVKFRTKVIDLLQKGLNFKVKNFYGFRHLIGEYLHEMMNWDLDKSMELSKRIKDIYCINALNNIQWYALLMPNLNHYVSFFDSNSPHRIGKSTLCMSADMFCLETGAEIAEYVPMPKKAKELLARFSERLSIQINTNPMMDFDDDRLLIILEYLDTLLPNQTVVVFPYVYSDKGVTFGLVNNTVLKEFISSFTKYESLIEHSRDDDIYIPKLLTELPYHRHSSLKIVLDNMIGD